MAGYMGYGYSPIGSAGFGYTPQQYYPMQQPIQQNITQQPTRQPIQGIRFVSEDEAKAYIVSPNESVMLMDIPNKKFWIKSADSLGQSTFEPYKFEKYIEGQTTTSNEQKIDYENFVKREDMSDIAKKDDLRAILAQLDRLEKKISINQFIGSETANKEVKQNDGK